MGVDDLSRRTPRVLLGELRTHNFTRSQTSNGRDRTTEITVIEGVQVKRWLYRERGSNNYMDTGTRTVADNGFQPKRKEDCRRFNSEYYNCSVRTRKLGRYKTRKISVTKGR